MDAVQDAASRSVTSADAADRGLKAKLVAAAGLYLLSLDSESEDDELLLTAALLASADVLGRPRSRPEKLPRVSSVASESRHSK